MQAKAVKPPVIPIIIFPWLSFETGGISKGKAAACLAKYIVPKVQLSSPNLPAIRAHVNCCVVRRPFLLLLYIQSKRLQVNKRGDIGHQIGEIYIQIKIGPDSSLCAYPRGDLVTWGWQQLCQDSIQMLLIYEMPGHQLQLVAASSRKQKRKCLKSTLLDAFAIYKTTIYAFRSRSDNSCFTGKPG